MHSILLILSIVLWLCPSSSFGEEKLDESITIQTDSIRDSCRKAQICEKNIKNLLASIDILEKQEKTTLPVVRDIYRILMRCYTVLFDIHRFSNIWSFIQEENKNNAIRAAIIIKNFAIYFDLVKAELKNTNNGITNLRAEIQSKKSLLKEENQNYSQLCEKIAEEEKRLGSMRRDNVIRDDVVYHLASKSETIEELDAELEAENAVGVLKNTKVATKLSIIYPAAGRLVNEFGDRGVNDEMIHYIAFEMRPAAIITAPSKGLVVFAGKFLNYGNVVIISNGEFRLFLFGLGKLFVATGDIVEVGDYIGRMPSNGKDSILKLELKKSGESLDPRHWMVVTEEKENK